MGDSSHFENSPSFRLSWTYNDVFQIKEKFIGNCLPCLLAKMTKGGALSSQASKMLYKPPEVVYITSYKELLDQSDCLKLFVQL